MPSSYDSSPLVPDGLIKLTIKSTTAMPAKIEARIIDVLYFDEGVRLVDSTELKCDDRCHTILVSVLQ